MQSTTKEIQAESTKLLEAQNEHAKNIISASQKIIEAQELACKKMHEKMNFKFYTSNSILLLIVCLIVLIGLNFAATYRYNQMRSTTLALTNEAYHLKQENNRLYSIRNEFIKMTKGSRKELLQRFPGLVINCTIPEQ
jgi:cytochrome c-type biogenesis protein CcmH/NrfG